MTAQHASRWTARCGGRRSSKVKSAISNIAHDQQQQQYYAKVKRTEQPPNRLRPSPIIARISFSERRKWYPGLLTLPKPHERRACAVVIIRQMAVEKSARKARYPVVADRPTGRFSYQPVQQFRKTKWVGPRDQYGCSKAVLPDTPKACQERFSN